MRNQGVTQRRSKKAGNASAKSPGKKGSKKQKKSSVKETKPAVNGKRVVKEKFGSQTVREHMPDGEVKTTKQRSRGRAWFSDTFRALFLPEGYPESVSDDYAHYQMWDTVQALCSSVTGVLATHAVLKGIGVGEASATALAATMQWIVKDGCGMISRIVFAWSHSRVLDANAKTWRLMADILNDLALCIQLASPYFPSIFLPLMCAANVCHGLVGVAGGATRAVMTAHQSKCNNMADVAAKDGSQETAVGLMGLILGMIITPIVSGHPTLTWSLFVVAVSLHLYANYKAVSGVVFESLNRQRMDIILHNWTAHNGGVLTPKQVAAKEKVLFFSREQTPIVLGVALDRIPDALNRIRGEHPDDYILHAEPAGPNKIRCVDVILRADVSPAAILRAYIHARLLVDMYESAHETGDIELISKHMFSTAQTLHSELLVSGWHTDFVHLETNEWRVEW